MMLVKFGVEIWKNAVMVAVFVVGRGLEGMKNVMKEKIPPDKCSICPLCPFYGACKFSPVLVLYEREQPLKQRLDSYRMAVYKCSAFINRIIDFDS